ncbi:2,3,4,5-tetrahydropyridine-2,6-dicarboxylate N-acetyltransferase [Natribacillus halophilus]|uniref:2,3,4,5-tetrahydropyridine-2,6-dicarboxylate N-acetyltransferase n=1 Tax=Natribacillus halophilus TaxID=549003 RepID=A0A1G8MA87_9BACI|nr:2,3,4,5-tetrahydropyridine-2,6-dicarboxylate N-acetyltransferase [Natribacillus halophilus]SDI64858.1 2,3,4,5-tetrahydropyridine-2,6-dicarboxylate N-acetyltransferase [Natribacillus halophilus]
MEMMDGNEIIQFISDSEKSTPVKVYIKGEVSALDFGADTKVFPSGDASAVLFGEWSTIRDAIEQNKEKVEDYVVENDRRNSAVPLVDMKEIPARIEPGAVIRDRVDIGKNAIIMMGAMINIGSVVGENTMIDMNAVLGGRATVGNNCHIGAGSVLAGVIEPPSATPVIIEDDVVLGANVVVLEGVTVGKGSVVAAGAIVTEDVPENKVVAGTPARVVKDIDESTRGKTEIKSELRKLKDD